MQWIYWNPSKSTKFCKKTNPDKQKKSQTYKTKDQIIYKNQDQKTIKCFEHLTQHVLGTTTHMGAYGCNKWSITVIQ